MIGLFDAHHFLSFVQNDRFRAALRRFTDLGPIVDAADVEQRRAELNAHLEERWRRSKARWRR